jgi:parallel beta-helix repeat protein
MKWFASLAFSILVSANAYAQCSFGCPTADEVAVQQQLDAAAAAGGGVVQLEARVYNICSPLIVGSNTHLRGAGRGATIIRGSAVATQKTIDNARVIASIAAVAARNVTISELTVDHATCSRNANGVAFLPSGVPGDGGETYNGTPVKNSAISRIEVLGAPQYHSYMIWNLKGRHIRIVENWIDGGASTTSNQEGIESFGGINVLISGNTVKNIGFACISIGNAGIPASDLFGVLASQNYLTDCTIGINLGTSVGSEAQSNYHTRISGNVISYPREIGIDVSVAHGTVESDLMINNNSISDMRGDQVAAIRLRSTTTPIANDAVIANTISNNHIDHILGPNAHGIRLLSYPNVRILDNTISGTEHAGIYALDSDDLEIVGNRIEKSGVTPILLNGTMPNGFTHFVVERNLLRDWTTSSAGILVVTGKFGTVRDNVLKRSDGLMPTPIILATDTCSVTATGNTAWYYPSWTGVTVAACPETSGGGRTGR